MPRLNIIIDIDAEDGDAERLVECWLHAMADSEIEVVDPNTGLIIGKIAYESHGVVVRYAE